MPHLEHLPSGRWRAQVVRRPRRWAKTFNTKEMARSWALDLEDLIDAGGDPDAAPAQQPSLTVGQFEKLWWSARVAEKTTLKANRSRLDNHVLPYWRNVQLSVITPMQVQSWVKELQGKGLAPATVASCHHLLSGMLIAAVREGRRLDNPAAYTKLPTIPRGREVFFTHKQIDELAAATIAERDRLLILLLAYTGLRWGEATGLRVAGVDFLRRTIHVTRVETRYGPKDYPKSSASRRTVPAPKFLTDDLAAYLAGRGLGRDDLLFQTKFGEPIADRQWRRAIWHPALKRAELTHLAARPHDLRHTAASWLAIAGVPLLDIAHFLGHSSTRMAERYAHLSPDHGDRARTVLDAIAAARTWGPDGDGDAKQANADQHAAT